MKPHEIWLYKARNDLRSAKILVERDDPVLDTSIYHTQQCAEKALKGFLVFKKHNIEKTHDVDYLIECCIDYDDEFKTLLDLGNTLSSYGTLFRYPGPILDPEIEDVYEAIKVAEEILDFVAAKINKM